MSKNIGIASLRKKTITITSPQKFDHRSSLELLYIPIEIFSISSFYVHIFFFIKLVEVMYW